MTGEPIVYVDDDRVVLVQLYLDGTMTVATRPEPAAVWGPPVTVKLERRF